MGIFSRFADIVNANVNALLDKAENPEKMVRLIIQEMEDTLIEVRTTYARALADKKEVVRKMTTADNQVKDWQEKATLALKKDREDLARAALIEKQRVFDVFLTLQEEVKLIEENITKLNNEVTELENKLNETRARQQALILRAETANKRLQAKKQVNNYRTEEALAKFEKFERRVDEFEAQADSYETNKASSLKDEFAELKVQDEITKELEKMKAEIKNQVQKN